MIFIFLGDIANDYLKTGRKKDESLKGRYRKISVKDRYLESFIREML